MRWTGQYPNRGTSATHIAWQLDRADGARILLPSPFVATGHDDEGLASQLKRLGAIVTCAPAYAEADLVTGTPTQPELSLLVDGKIDAICLASPAEARGLATLLQSNPPCRCPVVLAVGIETELAASKCGIAVDLVADDRVGPVSVLEVCMLHYKASRTCKLELVGSVCSKPSMCLP